MGTLTSACLSQFFFRLSQINPSQSLFLLFQMHCFQTGLCIPKGQSILLLWLSELGLYFLICCFPALQQSLSIVWLQCCLNLALSYLPVPASLSKVFLSQPGS